MSKTVLLLGLAVFTFVYFGQAKKWNGSTCMAKVLTFIDEFEVEKKCINKTYAAMDKQFPNIGTVTCQQCAVQTNFPDYIRSYEVKEINALFMLKKKMFSSKNLKKNLCSKGIEVQIHCNFKAFIGDDCVVDGDCYGSDTMCFLNVCSCKDGFTYIQEKGKCVKGNLRLGQICEVNSQCYPPNSYCKKEQSDNYQCSCIKDYLEDEYGGCYRVNLPLGSICEYDIQCISNNCGNVNSKSMKICSCPAYMIQINQSCYKSNIGLGEECKYNQQCNRTKFAWLCSVDSHGNKVCSCLNRMINFQDMECVQGNLHVGAYCDQDIQCGATPNAKTCSHNSCSCDPGFVQKDSYCIKETNTNSQGLTREATGSSNNAGVTIGAFLGGLVLGALIVMTIGVLLYRKRNKYHRKSRKNEQSGVSNQAYDSEMRSESHIIGQKRNVLYSNVETESMQPKVSMVTPICKQVDSESVKAASKDNIYNHLNETEGDERDDLYDHAHPIQEACVVQSDDDAYMHVQMTDGREDTDNQEEEGNYFTLDKEQK